MLCNLKEAHAQFSKFPEFSPKYCVLAGSSGTHSVCVCCIHENVKLMIDGAGLARLTRDTLRITSYKDCLSSLICNPPATNCYYLKCDTCPGSEFLADQLKDVFDNHLVDTISYKQ